MIFPRGRRGNADGPASLAMTVRLNSRSLARKLHACSRGCNVSINQFCNAAIAVAVDNPKHFAEAAVKEQRSQSQRQTYRLPKEKLAPKEAVTKLANSDSSDAFDFITLTQLTKMSQSCNMAESQAHQLIGLFIDAIRNSI